MANVRRGCVRGPVAAGAARGLVLGAAVGIAYAVASAAAFVWFGALGIGPVFFPAAGLTVAVLCRMPTRAWPVIVLAVWTAEVVVDLWYGLPPGAAVGFGLANVVEPALGAFLVVRAVGRPVDVGRAKGLAAFLALAVLVAPVAGGIVGATTDAWFGPDRGWWPFLARWWVGDGLGVLVVGTTILAWTGSPSHTQRSRLVSWLVIVAVAVVDVAVFWREQLPLAYLMVAGLVWIALRFGIRGVTLASLILTLTAVPAAAADQGLGQLLVPGPMGVVYLQLVLVVLITTLLLLAVEVHERDHAVAEAAEAHAAARTAERGERLHRLVTEVYQRLDDAAGADDRGRALVDALVPTLADYASLELVGASGRLQPAVGKHVDPRDEEHLRALRERHGLSADDPRAPARVIATGRGECLAVPLATPSAVVGGLLLGYGESGRRYAPEDVVLVEDIAARAALAIENARLYEREHAVALALQTSMLPATTPTVPGVRIAAHYQPNEDDLSVGGDWYDVQALPDGRLTVTIGDVVGHGLEAAAAMGQLRAAASALALAGLSPASLLTRLDEFADGLPAARWGSACCGVFDPATGLLRYASAGHPPPLLVEPGAAPRYPPVCARRCSPPRSPRASSAMTSRSCACTSRRRPHEPVLPPRTASPAGPTRCVRPRSMTSPQPEPGAEVDGTRTRRDHGRGRVRKGPRPPAWGTCARGRDPAAALASVRPASRRRKATPSCRLCRPPVRPRVLCWRSRGRCRSN